MRFYFFNYVYFGKSFNFGNVDWIAILTTDHVDHARTFLDDYMYNDTYKITNMWK